MEPKSFTDVEVRLLALEQKIDRLASKLSIHERERRQTDRLRLRLVVDDIAQLAAIVADTLTTLEKNRANGVTGAKLLMAGANLHNAYLNQRVGPTALSAHIEPLMV